MGTIDWNAFAIVLMYNAYSSMVRQYTYVLLSWSCKLSVASWAVSLKHRTTHAQFLFIKGEDKQCLNKLLVLFIFRDPPAVHQRVPSGNVTQRQRLWSIVGKKYAILVKYKSYYNVIFLNHSHAVFTEIGSIVFCTMIFYMATVYGKAESACSPIHDKFITMHNNFFFWRHRPFPRAPNYSMRRHFC